LTAKLSRLLNQAVPVVMLVMQVIDETTKQIMRRLVSSDVPVYCDTADKQNGPPMNADKRRWDENLRLSAFIRVHRRPNPVQGLQIDGQDRTPSFPNVIFEASSTTSSQCLMPSDEWNVALESTVSPPAASA
jgi:hypothetical protein